MFVVLCVQCLGDGVGFVIEMLPVAVVIRLSGLLSWPVWCFPWWGYLDVRFCGWIVVCFGLWVLELFVSCVMVWWRSFLLFGGDLVAGFRGEFLGVVLVSMDCGFLLWFRSVVCLRFLDCL